MTLRRASLALSLVALAAPAAASSRPDSSITPESAASAPTLVQPAPAAPKATHASKSDAPVDPVAIAFDVSADHDAVDAGGPKVLKYVIDFVPVAGAPGTSHSVDLGKPKPEEGSISVSLTKVLLPGTYLAHVRAVGRGLKMSTATVGPFVITDRMAASKAEFEKAQRERQEMLRREEKQRREEKKDKKPKAPKDAPPSDSKGGFWKKFYEKIVG